MHGQPSNLGKLLRRGGSDTEPPGIVRSTKLLTRQHRGLGYQILRHRVLDHPVVRHAVVLSACCVALLTPAAARAQDRLALVIGNSDYPAPYVTPLPSCVNDAQAIHDFLRSAGYPESTIDLLKNATRQQMVQAFARSLQAARDSRVSRGRPLDQFVFFYSGHGMTVQDGSGNDQRDEGEGDLSDEAFVAVPPEGGRPTTTDELLIRDDLFFAFLQQMSRETRQLIVLLDACHSGGLFRSAPTNTADGPAYPNKSISEQDLAKYLQAVGATTSGLRPEQDDVRSRDIVREHTKLPRELESIECDFLFAAASAEDQRAAGGDPRSQFTDGLMQALVTRRDRILRAAGTDLLTIDLLDKYLTEQLASYQQQRPMLLCRGSSIQPSTAFLGELFPAAQNLSDARDRADTDRDAAQGDAIHEAFTWRLLRLVDHERPRAVDPHQPLPTGQPFRLQIEPSDDRYLYVLYLEPDSEPILLLPELAAGEQADDYLLPARFRVSVPRDGHFVFTPPAGIERVRVVLARQPLRLQHLERLSAWPAVTVSSRDDLDGRAARGNERQRAFVLAEPDHRQRVFVPARAAGDPIVLELELRHH